MKLGDLLECSLPLLAEGDDDDYPYWFGGTCFLVRHQGELFVVTAKHCLRSKTSLMHQQKASGLPCLLVLPIFRQSSGQRGGIGRLLQPKELRLYLLEIVDCIKRMKRQGSVAKLGKCAVSGISFSGGPALNLIKSLVPELDAQAKAKAGNKRPTSFDELIAVYALDNDPGAIGSFDPYFKRWLAHKRHLRIYATERYDPRVVSTYTKGANKRIWTRARTSSRTTSRRTAVERIHGFQNRTVPSLDRNWKWPANPISTTLSILVVRQ